MNLKHLKHNCSPAYLTERMAFTLAEILITLGIIGVVAAMTLPVLINKTQNKELHALFLKTYSELNQIAYLFMVDNGISFAEYASSNTSVTATANKLASYYKGSTSLSTSGMGTADEDGNYVALYEMHNLNGSSYSGGANSQNKNSSFFCDNSPFKTNQSGAVFILNDNPNENYNGPVICVDINGKKGPNRYGVDYFLFIFTVDGKVIPMGQEHKNNALYACSNASASCGNFNNTGSKYCSAESSNIAYNTSCAYYALSNTHPSENGKDYWKDFLGEVYHR